MTAFTREEVYPKYHEKATRSHTSGFRSLTAREAFSNVSGAWVGERLSFLLIPHLWLPESPFPSGDR